MENIWLRQKETSIKLTLVPSVQNLNKTNRSSSRNGNTENENKIKDSKNNGFKTSPRFNDAKSLAKFGKWHRFICLGFNYNNKNKSKINQSMTKNMKPNNTSCRINDTNFENYCGSLNSQK